MYTNLIKQLIHMPTMEGKEHLEHLFNEMFEDIKEKDPAKYKHIKCKLYRYVYANHLSEELAEHWVNKMKNEDGTIGGHWTLAETEANNPYKHHKFDWYATLNMMYSDYYDAKFTTEDYIHLANKFLADKDAPEDKLLEYYFHIADKE